MRRFACQRLYLSPDTYFIRYVVELGNNGKIQSYYPLEEEIYACLLYTSPSPRD